MKDIIILHNSLSLIYNRAGLLCTHHFENPLIFGKLSLTRKKERKKLKGRYGMSTVFSH